ncbi:hypothetical protein [Streptomyces sp. NBC_01530]|uniref:hypothetical protein n=1 Tax=Streptomyces sp. NBC_01530 TaxID=2903895 RepID=UPI003866150D
MAVNGRSRVPTRRDLAEEELMLDTYRGRRYCKQHPSQQMIPLGVADVCPLEHSAAGEQPVDQ